MAYFAPNVSAAGLSLPLFTDIQTFLEDAFLAAYGETNYLGNDAADFQYISAFSLALNNNMQLAQLVYNNRSPLTATGAGLDLVCKINGLARLPASSSTVTLALVGTPGTPVTNAVVSDENGILWSLPMSVTIGSGGTVNAIAICQQTGAISAAANTITNPVGGFTAGWTSVTNAAAATLGTPPESDSQFRARQSISVATPSETRLAGTISDVEAIPGVTRTNILENQLSVTDGFGNESHSLTCVVDGSASALAIATAIYANRGIGCNTQGATTTTMVITPVTDPVSGDVTSIGYIIPTYVPIFVSLSVHGLTNAFNSAVQANIIAAVISYLNNLDIGEEVTQSALYGAALAVMPNLLQPWFSIRAVTLGTSASPSGTTDITLLFYQVASGVSGNVLLTVV